jgi:hypothetical protein
MTRTGGYQQMQIVDQFNTGTLTQTISSPMLTPWVQGGFAVSGALRMANWFYVSDASSAIDGAVVRLAWNRVISSTSHFHQWHIIMPANQFALVFPKLPAQFNDNMPGPADSVSGAVRVFDITGVNGYDAVRMQPSGNIMCIDCALRAGDYTRAIFSGNVQ